MSLLTAPHGESEVGPRGIASARPRRRGVADRVSAYGSSPIGAKAGINRRLRSELGLNIGGSSSSSFFSSRLSQNRD
jgi:hypothetical protein